MKAARAKVTRTAAAVAALVGMVLGPGPGPACAESWTIAAHVCATGDLTEPGLRYAERLTSAARAGGWPLALQIVTAENTLVRQSMPRGPGEGESAVLSEGASPADAMEGLLRWTRVSAPAENYVLIVYGHHPQYAEEAPDGRVASEMAPAGSMEDGSVPNPTSGEIAAGIRGGLGRPVDVLVLDRCYGANVETLWDLRRDARVLLASPGRRSSTGVEWKSALGGRPTSPATAAALAMRWIADAGHGESSGMLAMRPAQLVESVPAVRRLVATAAADMKSAAPLLTRARSRAAVCDRCDGAELIDLRQFCKELARTADGDLKTDALETAAAVGMCVLGSGESEWSGPNIAFAASPDQAQSGSADAGFCDETGWWRLTQSYHQRLRELLNRTSTDGRNEAA